MFAIGRALILGLIQILPIRQHFNILQNDLGNHAIVSIDDRQDIHQSSGQQKARQV